MNRKTTKYAELVKSLNSVDPIQFGSQGYLTIESFLPIKNPLGLTTHTFSAVLVNSVGAAITH